MHRNRSRNRLGQADGIAGMSDAVSAHDPPRAGVPKSAIEQLRQVRPKQVVYVSCHPATLARDLNALCADGVFEVRSVVPLDMFPQTQHVECVADVRLVPRDAA